MTAVEWFAKQVLRSRQLGFISNEKFNELLEQAKEMEKQNIIKTAINCHFEGVRQSAKTSEEYIEYGEQYYNEKFKNK